MVNLYKHYQRIYIAFYDSKIEIGNILTKA